MAVYTGVKTAALADDFVRQGGDHCAHVVSNVASVSLLSEKLEVVSLWNILKKVRKEARKVKKELDALCDATRLDKGERIVAWARIREDRHKEVKTCSATTWRSGAISAKLRIMASVTVNKCGMRVSVSPHVATNCLLLVAVFEGFGRAEL